MTDIFAVMTDKRPGHPETLPFPHLTGYWVNRLGGAFRTFVDRELREFDLTRRQVGMLMHISEGLASSAADLTKSLGVDSTAITRMLDRLEDKELVMRAPDPNDGRRQLVTLTGKARSLMPELRQVAKRVETRFESQIGAGDLATFHRVLMAMLETVGESHFKALDDEGSA